MSRGKIVVVGSSNTDMVMKAPRLPGPGETVLGGAFAELPGGKGANQAVAADILLLQLEVPLDAVSRAIELARDRGTTIILDPAPAQPVPDTLLAQVDIITPNLHEARTLAGGDEGRCSVFGVRSSDSGTPD